MALVLIFQDQIITAYYFVVAAALLDFFDGFAARLLKAHSPIGKDLDSLADMVTFGVVPGIMLFQISNGYLTAGIFGAFFQLLDKNIPVNSYPVWVPFAALLIPVFSALRLAIFNNDSRQTDSFIGLPTPANAIFICSIPFMIAMGETNLIGFFASKIITEPWLFVFFCCLMSYLLVAELRLFSLKFKNFSLADNKVRFIFLGISILLILFLKFSAIPIIILLYILLSVINNFSNKKNNHIST